MTYIITLFYLYVYIFNLEFKQELRRNLLLSIA